MERQQVNASGERFTAHVSLASPDWEARLSALLAEYRARVPEDLCAGYVTLTFAWEGTVGQWDR